MTKLKFFLPNTFICFVLVLTSCTFTTTSKKDPVFSKDNSTLESDLKNIVRCEEVNLNGTETKTGSKSSSELIVRIINGANIPSDENQMKELGKTIGTVLKKSLKDNNGYNTYKILFVTQVTKEAVTTSSYVGQEFKSEEL